MVKPLFVLSTFILLLFNSTYSQLYVGIKTGYTSAGTNQLQYAGRKAVNGFNAGAVVNYQFTDVFSLQAEVLYGEKGGGFELVFKGNTYSDYTTLKYIEIPVSPKLSVGKGKVKLTANIGPYIGILLSGENIEADSGFTVTTAISSDFYDDDGRKANKLDFGINIGSGCSVEIGERGKFLFEIRYGIGLKDWYQYNRNSLLEEERKNRVMGISIGYIYAIGSKF